VCFSGLRKSCFLTAIDFSYFSFQYLFFFLYFPDPVHFLIGGLLWLHVELLQTLQAGAIQ